MGTATLLVLLIGGLIGGVRFLTRDSRRGTTPELLRPLLAHALDLSGQIGAPHAGRDNSLPASMLRRSSHQDESGVRVSEDSTVLISAEVETRDTTPKGFLMSRARRTEALEAIAPRLTKKVDRFDWASVPAEAPLFRVFDETDTDVIPPGTKNVPLRDDLRLVWNSGFQGKSRAQLEARVGSEVGRRVAMVEVTISERGDVERARLISAPSSIHGAMLLSVIKAWQFTPATKDGLAVRYRQVMPLIAAR